jgi:hypothetical protein
MTNKELVELSKTAMEQLSAGNNMLEHEQTAYNCLRLFCERIEQTKELKQIIEILQVCANKNLMRGEELDQVSWRDREGVLITNRQALDIAKYTPLYHD